MQRAIQSRLGWLKIHASVARAVHPSGCRAEAIHDVDRRVEPGEQQDRVARAKCAADRAVGGASRASQQRECEVCGDDPRHAALADALRPRLATKSP